jgi:hypothetical protein
MVKAEFVPAIGEQLIAAWIRRIEYKGFDLKFFTDKSHFQTNIALQSAYYGVNGSAKNMPFKELIKFPKSKVMVGDSVDSNETIIIRKKGEITFQNVFIGDFVDNILNNKFNISLSGHEFLDIIDFEVLTLDNNFMVSWKDIKQVIRHKTNKKGLQIQTIGGKSILLTKDHSLMQFDTIDKLKSIKCSELENDKKENKYIISYDKLNLGETNLEKISGKVKYFNKEEDYQFYLEKDELTFIGFFI